MSSFQQGPPPASSSNTNDPTANQSYVNNLQFNSVSFPYTTQQSDNGSCIYSGSGTNTATIAAGYGNNATLAFVNMSAGAMTINSASDPIVLAGSGATGTRTLTQYGVATFVKMPSGSWLASGTNLS